MSTLATVKSYLNAGLCVLPAKTDEKRPLVPSWTEFQKKLPTDEQILNWFFDGAQTGACIIAGAVSGNLEMIDFDGGAELFDAWAKIVEEEEPGLLAALVIETSQSGGKHVIYRAADAISGNQKLAQRSIVTPSAEPITHHGKKYTPRKNGDGFEAVITLIETRGEGGLFLCAPTPGYIIEFGDLSSPPTITAEHHTLLLRAALALNEIKSHVISAPKPPPFLHTPLTPTTATTAPCDDRPGDDYSRRGDVGAILVKHGWRLTGGGENQRWLRPGKQKGWSATLKDRVFYVFSSNAAPFEPHKGYGPFGVYALLEHGGDYAKAARALRADGYGSQGRDDSDVDLSAFNAASPAEELEEDETPAPSDDPKDPGPFPENLLNVPGFINEVMEYNLSTAFRRQPVLALAGAIALQAILAARKVRDIRGNRTNLYLVSLAGAGQGKDHARKVNREILAEADMLILEGNEEIASDAGLLGVMESGLAALLQVDEFGRFLQTAGDPRKAPHLYSILTLLMKLYSSADTVFKGKAYANSKQNKTINQPCTVLLATTVPENFYESLTASALQDGFMARLLVWEGMANSPRQFAVKTPVPPTILQQAKFWNSLQGTAMQWLNPNPKMVPYTDEAKRVFSDLGDLADAEAVKDGAGQSLWARAEEKACRLALVYACSADATNPVVDEAAAMWACELASYSTRWIIWKAGHWVSENPFDAKQKRILRLFNKHHGKMTRSLFYRYTSYWTTKDREELIGNMINSGLLEQKSVPTKTKTKTMYVMR